MSVDDPRRFLKNFLLHFRPITVPERTLRFSLAWGLGVASTALLMLLMASGLLLKFVYEPTPANAYDSIVYLGSEVPLGQVLRNLHRWSAYALLSTAFLHLLRVFYTGAFHAPRQLNWIVGLALFTLVVVANFTGYLLPWDQISFWAVTISTSILDYLPGLGTPLKQWILGGDEPGPATLMNFYAIHTAVLPILFLFALPFHFWRIRKANGTVVPRAPGEELPRPLPMVRTVPHLVTREIAVALTVVALMLALALLFDAPLAEQANPGLSPNPTKAPWYFMGIQETLMHLHPLFAAVVIPGLIVLGLLALPYLGYDEKPEGVWFCSAAGRKTVLLAAVLGLVLTTAAVLADEAMLAAGSGARGDLFRHGLLPFSVIALLCAGFYAGVRKLLGANRNEAVQALFTLLISAFLSLTLIGNLFRGPGMQLAWAG